MYARNGQVLRASVMKHELGGRQLELGSLKLSASLKIENNTLCISIGFRGHVYEKRGVRDPLRGNSKQNGPGQPKNRDRSEKRHVEEDVEQTS